MSTYDDTDREAARQYSRNVIGKSLDKPGPRLAVQDDLSEQSEALGMLHASVTEVLLVLTPLTGGEPSQTEVPGAHPGSPSAVLNVIRGNTGNIQDEARRLQSLVQSLRSQRELD